MAEVVVHFKCSKEPLNFHNVKSFDIINGFLFILSDTIAHYINVNEVVQFFVKEKSKVGK